MDPWARSTVRRTIASPSSELKVLPLPTQGQPKDFSGAVADFQVSSDISPARVAAGDPLTLRLHVSGVGNFDRVDSTLLDRLDPRERALMDLREIDGELYFNHWYVMVSAMRA